MTKFDINLINAARVQYRALQKEDVRASPYLPWTTPLLSRTSTKLRTNADRHTKNPQTSEQQQQPRSSVMRLLDDCWYDALAAIRRATNSCLSRGAAVVLFINTLCAGHTRPTRRSTTRYLCPHSTAITDTRANSFGHSSTVIYDTASRAYSSLNFYSFEDDTGYFEDRPNLPGDNGAQSIFRRTA